MSLLVDGEDLELNGDEVQVAVVAAEGFAAAGGRAGVVVLHTTVDDELLDEGLGREILARLQNRRKQLSLGYSDRVTLVIRGGERMARVVEQQRAHIMREAQCDALTVEPLVGDESDELWTLAEVQGERIAFRIDRTVS